MRYPVKVFEVPIRRKVAGALHSDPPRLVKSFDVSANTLEKARKIVAKEIESGAHIFRGKVLRSLSVSPDPRPRGGVIVYIQALTREARNIRRSMKKMEPR